MSRFISSIVVKTRKNHKCFGCRAIIPKGTKLEVITLVEDDIYRIRTCEVCKEFEKLLKAWEFEEFFEGGYPEDERWQEIKRKLEEIV